MTEESRVRPRREVWLFFILTFVISWGAGGVALLLKSQLEPILGPLGPHHPLFYVAGWAPTLAAVILTIALQGWAGLKVLFGRLLVPFQLRWLVVAALFIPAIALALTALPLLGFGPWPVTPRMIFVALPMVLFGTAQIVANTGPLGEELGWRGYALPRLLERTSAFIAALVIGLFWVLWHVPAFFISGVMGASISGFGWWALDTLALSVLMTWLFLRANGNVLVAGMVPHFVINGMGAVAALLARPPEAAAMAMVALTVVVLDRRRMLVRPAGIPARPDARG
ncbi:membrane protease YdiL (CAAX protease family) [Caulobacter ginsengisoli]|uniref:Membrane protease YdiL (CAAX protease family) n=1 Tax=Caulobacter ginsengisoli TaxID=400775 RepID=A0ABU0IVM2_9CAUL|nr:type II CAAX endopeptidase family protein [Caulobacter ginsengisoli]MDQ0466055.1 membrane protease YdiL (CAAX protease family) [Caulobacter ginsengisoli]